MVEASHPALINPLQRCRKNLHGPAILRSRPSSICIYMPCIRSGFLNSPTNLAFAFVTFTKCVKVTCVFSTEANAWTADERLVQITTTSDSGDSILVDIIHRLWLSAIRNIKFTLQTAIFVHRFSSVVDGRNNELLEASNGKELNLAKIFSVYTVSGPSRSSTCGHMSMASTAGV
ncbi:hypothetical protein BJX66DRAFT_320351 [Aspergillus keveii]|uniref:Uncharacterized protein n=1 Tax=Aspergillus keveii TaxID=714993 RepID=A0ABR4FH55_9EURO